jgi:hypothetical protein
VSGTDGGWGRAVAVAAGGRDPRVRHLRRLKRSQRGARRWTVISAASAGATAVLVPYAGIGLPDVGWVAFTTGAVALTLFRWKAYLTTRAEPVPEPPPPALPGGFPFAGMLPGQLGAVLSRAWSTARIPSSSAVREPARRLERASKALHPLLHRLGTDVGHPGREVQEAEVVLRELVGRVVAVEGTFKVVPPESAGPLAEARDGLVVRLDEGVTAYERLVGAAAECVAAQTATDASDGTHMLAIRRLEEAAETLSGLAAGLTELREQQKVYGFGA